MPTRKRVPAKLKHDMIVEALVEVRFDTKTVPEVLIGRLADCPSWKGFEPNPMPANEIPAFIRQVDPNFRYQPVLELRDIDKTRIVRVGSNVFSYHRLQPYGGWSLFQPEVNKAIDALFAKADSLTIRRLGLRYINALRSDLHQIQSILDLDLKVVIEDERLAGNVNVNLAAELSSDTHCTVRVSTPEFVQGITPVNSRVVIDVDVFTKDAFTASDAQTAKQWVDSAHTMEKQQFFRLLTETTINALEER